MKSSNRRRLSFVILLVLLETAWAWVIQHRQPRFSANARLRRSTALGATSKEPKDRYRLRLLVVDHYDSFTYNLVDLLAQLCHERPMVVAGDAADSWTDLSATIGDVDAIVLSPGPGHPSQCRLAMDVVKQNPDLPILGVCLGHQVLGQVYGAEIDLAPVPIHGQVWPIQLLDDPLWYNLSSPLNVVRYHSLCVVGDLESTPLRSIAEADGVCMGLHHVERPHVGVQFHPESAGTEGGRQLLRNFLDMCVEAGKAINRDVRATPTAAPRQESSPYQVYMHHVTGDHLLTPQQAFDAFLADADYSFWLDAARYGATGVSILGSGRRRVEYYGAEQPRAKQGVYVYDGDQCERLSMDIVAYLDQEHATSTKQVTMVDFVDNPARVNGADAKLVETRLVEEDALPFDYRGGHVGYLGYEVRHDTARYQRVSEHGRGRSVPPVAQDSATPTAAFVFADQSMVYDHATGDWYLVAVMNRGDSDQDAVLWMQRTAEALRDERLDKDESRQDAPRVALAESVAFLPNRAKQTYADNIAQCHEYIRQGQSYELCLTNQLEARVSVDAAPLELYRILRRRNPAPHSAFFNWNSLLRSSPNGETPQTSLAICCSSPERFVSVQRTQNATVQVEAKPIKGTCARVLPANGVARTAAEDVEDQRRADELQQSVKNRAENLMIVDLLRNDLSRVCTPGTVHVAKLMDIESFATVHQMVSTIRGSLDPLQATSIDVLKASFPGGSMTGAPKVRTMELLHEIEEGVSRGPYSGCLGYISVNGCMDMNIIIRTVVLGKDESDGWNVKVGAGGAITALSDTEDEYDEMMLKASAVMGAVQEWATTFGKADAIPVEPEPSVNLTLEERC